MILKINNKDSFIKNFLSPVSRLITSATLDIGDGFVSTLAHNNSNIFLKAECKVEWEDNNDNIICLPDTNKLIKILSCLDEESIELNITNNCINYNNGKGNRFKYHLFDDSLQTNTPFDFDKINTLELDTNFTFTKESNNSMLKALPFVTETSKAYLFTEDDRVFVELGDKKLQNTDTYTTVISDKLHGEPLSYELILDVELFRLISTLNYDSAEIYINSKFKMLLLKLSIDDCKLTFVSTSYKN
tara:strand:+ start:576 stop:1310 length:735 start_codon:yes stop_codon:yes gene_type:complete